MKAARVAAMHGHEVSLYEKNNTLGGNLIPGGSHSFRKEVRRLNAWYQNELNQLSEEIHTGEAVIAEQLRSMNADVIILAVGPTSVMLPVPRIEDEKVLSCMDAFAHPEKMGQKVAVIAAA